MRKVLIRSTNSEDMKKLETVIKVGKWVIIIHV